MSPPRRRSARLRGSDATPRKVRLPILHSIKLGLPFFVSNEVQHRICRSLTNRPRLIQNYAHNSRRLSSLVEGDETPVRGPQQAMDIIASSPHTPATAGRVKPPREEMHPTLAHQSTAKKPDSGLRLGFIDVNMDASTRQQSGNGPLNTPSKVPASSTFDFRFARPPPDLGPEAQRMMDDLREEALRIKAKLAAEREEDKRQSSSDNISGMTGRRIAQPKGKVGRFSDVHMAEFKKMDSIAGHPSAYRAQSSRAVTTTRSLKRSQSKAKLDDRNDQDDSGHNTTAQQELSKDITSVKRARKETSEISSAGKQPMQATTAAPSTPSSKHSRIGFLEHLTTPTQSSLARASNVKTSQIPTISKSPSKSGLSTPGRLTKSATTGNLRSVTKSILRRPEKSSIPTAMTPAKIDLNKGLPSVPGSGQLIRTQSVKRVNFTPNTKDVAPLEQSPSPVKSGIPRSKSNQDFSAVRYPALPVTEDMSKDVNYPSLSPMRVHAQTSQSRGADNSRPPASVPGTFTFRSDHTISFGASPGQASLRHVRPSNASAAIPGSFPEYEMDNDKPLPGISHGMANKKRHRAVAVGDVEALPESDKENFKPLSNISHGMSNKKRHRAGSDDEKEETERSPKKHKGNHVAQGAKLMGPQLNAKIQAEKSASKSKIPSPVKKGSISLSRLNMLARPKNRK